MLSRSNVNKVAVGEPHRSNWCFPRGSILDGIGSCVRICCVRISGCVCVSVVDKTKETGGLAAQLWCRVLCAVLVFCLLGARPFTYKLPASLFGPVLGWLWIPWRGCTLAAFRPERCVQAGNKCRVKSTILVTPTAHKIHRLSLATRHILLKLHLFSPFSLCCLKRVTESTEMSLECCRFVGLSTKLVRAPLKQVRPIRGFNPC